MAFFIKNIDTANVSIDDLGILLTPNETYDLTQDRGVSVAQSTDLPAAITAGTVAVLDPLDDATPLTLSRALDAVAAMNDTHYRIKGGDLDQLEDVVLGSLTDGEVLQYNAGTWSNVPASTVGAGASIQLEWKFSTSTTEADPGSGRFRFDSAVLSAVTEIYVNDDTRSGVDASAIINALNAGNKLYIQQKDTAASAALFTLTGDPIDNVGWFTIPVSVDDSNTLPGNNKDCGWVLLFSSGATFAPRLQTIYVGKHGNDTNTGSTPEEPKLTFGAAITAASALTPSASNKISVHCEDAGTYTESFTIPSFVLVKAPNSSFVGNVVIEDNAEFVFQEITAATGNVISKGATSTATGWATGEIVRATSSANAIVNTADTSVFIVRVRQIYAENGTGLLDQSTSAGHIHMDVEDMYITGTGTAIDRQTNSGIIVGRVSHILEQGAGIGNGIALDITNGSMTINVGTIECATAYSVSGAGTLNLIVNDIAPTAQRIQLSGAAEVNVIEADSLRWRNRSSNFTARRTEFVAIDTSAGPVTMLLPSPASNGDSVTFQDAINTFGTNNLTIDAQTGGLIDNGAGGAQTIVIELSGTAGVLIYNESLGLWTFSRIQEEVAFSPDNVIYVTKNGSDIIGDGSFSNPYLTVKKGVQEALTVATAANPTTVKVLDGIYEEDNPINVTGATSRYVQVQGSESVSTFVEPLINGQPLFTMTSAVNTDGPTLSRMTLRGQDNGGTDYKDVTGSNLIQVSGDGVFFLDDVSMEDANIAISGGNGTVNILQRIRWTSGAARNNVTGVNVTGANTFVDADVVNFRGNTTAINNNGGARVEVSNYEILGNLTTPAGTGVINNDASTFFANGGSVRGLALGLSANDTSQSNFLATTFLDNTTDFDQVDGTATITVQGTLSKTKQLIADGAQVSLNYINTDDGDYIIGNATVTGTPGREFRVRDSDGRVAIGDNATDANMADGAVGGGRTLNVIDSNGNMRIWRYVTDAGQDPALEWLKGTASAVDGAGRPGGPNPGDPAADVAAGTGTVWWDMFLQESDYFVIRRRTDGGGDVINEKVRIYPDHSEWLGATDYDDGDSATILYLQTVANAVNYLEVDNSATGNGPEIVAVGTDTNIDIEMIPKGTGTVVVPVGYDANIIDQSLITKSYFDANSTSVGLPVVQVRRTTTLAIPVAPAWGDLTFNLTDVETNATVIEHNNTTTQVIDIKEDGLYQISYTIPSDDEVTGRVVTDGAGGTAVIPGSQHLTGDITDANQVIVQNSPVFFAELSAGDQLVLQVQAQTTAEVVQAGSLLTVAKATGARGEQGEPGTGATIEVQDEGVSLGTNFSSLNFVGVQVQAAVGSPTSEATITVDGKQHLSRHNGGVTQTFTTTPTTINFGTSIRQDAAFTHNIVGGGSEITINEDGWYEITYDVSLDSPVGGSRTTSQTELQSNGTLVAGSRSWGYHRTGSNAEDSLSATLKLNLTSGDVVRVQSVRIAGTDALVTLADGCRLNIQSIDAP